MKTFKPILVYIIIYSSAVYGQYYQTIYSNRISFFNSQYGNIKCIRIDSTINQKDSVFFPFTMIQQLSYNCFSPYIASWIGKKVIINENGINLFFNKNNDTIKIDTKASLNDEWDAYYLADSLKIIARITRLDTISFIGLIDSVKTISFQVYDKNLNPLSFDINNMQLLLTKNYGFCKIFNFYLFPNFQVDYPTDQFEEYKLIGLSQPEVGVQNLTWFDVHDFQVGDELHILDESSSWDVFGGGNGYATTNKAIYKYLKRLDFKDSIAYTYSRKLSIYTTWRDSSSFKYYHDTLKTIIKPDSLFDKLPGEPIIAGNEAYNYYGIGYSKINPRENERFFLSVDSCWYIIIADGCLSNYKYIKGLGGPYYSCIHAFTLGGARRELVYYKKGENTWGTPLIITEIAERMLNSNIILFPNPAKNFITIQTKDNKNKEFTFEIFDINGRIIMTRRIDSDSCRISIADLKAGVYFYKLTNKIGLLKIDKLIIE